mmetsp:Transcript_4383/g.15411  ORF Transcript_4383/g.15411 Transcript_4383/m.15411 type:complete len:278 (+) Transcript_4383:182-1015(+)
MKHLHAQRRIQRPFPKRLVVRAWREAVVHLHVHCSNSLLKALHQIGRVRLRADVLLQEALERVGRPEAVKRRLPPRQDQEHDAAGLQHAVPAQQSAERVLHMFQNVARVDHLVARHRHVVRQVRRVADNLAAVRDAVEQRLKRRAVRVPEAVVVHIIEEREVIARREERVNVDVVGRRAPNLQSAAALDEGNDGVAVAHRMVVRRKQPGLLRRVDAELEAFVRADVAQRRRRGRNQKAGDEAAPHHVRHARWRARRITRTAYPALWNFSLLRHWEYR